MNILEACRHHSIELLVYASSSSVYGVNESMPFSVKDNVDHPVSLYSASKKANELMSHTYSYLYGLPAHLKYLIMAIIAVTLPILMILLKV